MEELDDQDLTAQLKDLKAHMDGLVKPSKTKKNEEEKPTDQLDPEVATVTLARRELKIQRQIGSSGQPDKLSFNSLARQIEDPLKKGYKAREVISAVAPGVPPRSYLEGRPDGTLPQLRRILGAHFKEPDTIDVYQELVAASQDHKESAHDFLIRGMSLCQKV